jgi:ubiquinone/menaquinone biosynthesis C-methylase UbiE
MQTKAEQHLVQYLITIIEGKKPGTGPIRILNIGAGASVSIEEQLVAAGCDFISDRVDIEPCSIDHPNIGTSWTCSVESMTPVEASTYPIAISNYVLEHVPRVDKAASEIHRVLKPQGTFIATVPNVSSPEFWLSKHTPTWVHKKIRGGKTWDTYYAFESMDDLARIFRSAGLTTQEVRYFPAIEQYVYRFPVAATIGRGMDKLLTSIKIKRLLGNVCLIIIKT